MPKIYDNLNNYLITGLKDSINVSFRGDFCVGYFNLRGWKQIVDDIEHWEGREGRCCRLLVGMHKSEKDIINEYFFHLNQNGGIDNQTALKLKKQIAIDFKEQLTIGIPTSEDERALRKLSQQLKDNKVVVKLYLKHSLHAKLYLLEREDKFNSLIGFVGSSNLTLPGLSVQGELNVDVLEQDAAQKLSKWFEDRWNDRWCIDISKELIEIIDNSWAAERLLSPFYIYLKIAYHLSREARAGLTEFNIPKIFLKQLLEFQQKAVLVAAHHLNKRGGVLIGDVVGLGKTMTATALAKIFEEDYFLETLIICPKNLVRMWEEYAHTYRLHAKVLSISRIQSELPDLRRFRLIIVDESHNLRNREGKRYKIIREYIQKNECKVILLSATPYNKGYLDVSSQLRLFLSEDDDIGASPENFIKSIGGAAEFNARYQVSQRSIAAFEKSDFSDDWRELLRLYMVRRTRSFIKENYAKTDLNNGRQYLEFSDGTRSYFPARIPKKVAYEFDPNDPTDQYAKLYSTEVVEIINHLDLPRYGLGNYINEKLISKATDKEKLIIDNLSRAGKRLKGFSRTNLFKRLESSGSAFLISISRHIIRNHLFSYAIENQLPLPIGAQEAEMLDIFLDDEDIEDSGKDTETGILLDEESYRSQAKRIYDLISQNYQSRYQWINSELFVEPLKKKLETDSIELLKILYLGKDWSSDNDRKLNALYKLCDETHRGEKVLIFTQFADTAEYIFNNLQGRGMHKISYVTGNHEDPTNEAIKFSPISNEKPEMANSEKELRVLITTDVLSEGQNLQDAHIILNYDLPWAIIRLIQRAGRIDRIGQKAEEIICYSFLPEDGIDQIINLRGRLTTRITENAEVIGADETFFEGDPINIKDLYNEKSGILDEADDNEVDLASFAYQIWNNAIKENPTLEKLIQSLPNVTYATKSIDKESEADQKGVIVYSRTADNNDVLTYIDEEGRTITESQLKILRAAKCSPETTPLPRIPQHHDLVSVGVEKIKEYEKQLGGQLGKKTSARYRVYARLNGYYERDKSTLFANAALKKAVDDIYQYPLKEYARETLNRQLKAGINDHDLVNLVISLQEEDKLCLTEQTEQTKREPQIICSMGITKRV